MRKRNTLKSVRKFRIYHGKKLIVAAASLLALYLIANLIFGEMGIIKYYRMKAQYDALTQDIGSLKQDNEKLAREVRALKTDPNHIEQIARDKLGLARQGEIVYYYGEP
jgi:cell division protein FtsB